MAGVLNLGLSVIFLGQGLQLSGSTLSVIPGIAIKATRDASASTTVLSTDYYIGYTGVGGHTITFIAASDNDGFEVLIKNKGSGTVTLDATSLGGIYTTSLVNTLALAPGEEAYLISDSSSWIVGDSPDSITGTAGQILINGGTGPVVGPITLTLASALTGINSITSTTLSALTLGTGTFGTVAIFASATGNLTLAGDLTVSGGDLVLSGTSTMTGGTGNMTITAGTGASRTLTLQTTTSGSAATNALVINDAQQVAAVATTASTSTTTGALIVSGGIGVAKDSWINSVRIGLGASSVSTNTVLGVSCGQAITTGSENVFIGYQAGKLVTGSNQNTIVGASAGKDATGSSNTFVGALAGYVVTSGGNNTFVGRGAGQSCLTTDYSVCVGAFAGFQMTGQRNIIIGGDAGYGTTGGASNVYIGFSAAVAATTSSTNVVIGYQAGISFTTATGGNIMLGHSAGRYETGSNAFYVDNQDRSNTAGDKAGAIFYGVFNATPASQTLTINAATTVSSATQSTTSTSGALTVSGGAGIAKNAYVGGLIHYGSAYTSSAAWGTQGIALRTDAQNNVVYTDTSSSGTVATAVINSMAGQLISASSVTTYTDAATLYLAGPPVANTNVTLSNAWTLWVDSGNVRFDGATTIAGMLTASGGITGGVQALSGAGAVDIVTLSTKVTSTGANALTLADGAAGQLKIITMIVDGGDATLTPTTKTGFTTITFTAVGNSAVLQFHSTVGWMIVSNYGATVA